jgi:hypothetical protein
MTSDEGKEVGEGELRFDCLAVTRFQRVENADWIAGVKVKGDGLPISRVASPQIRHNSSVP